MEIVHVSAECYPMAKAGGLGDVVGALPKYQQRAGHFAKVVMPMYRTRFLLQNQWEVDAQGYANLGDYFFNYTIIKLSENTLGFDLYLVDINGLLDREQIYGYEDDVQRFTAFQIAVLNWMSQWQHFPDVIHCHDHHTGLIPFMVKNCFAYQIMQSVRTVFTIHNAQYQGWMNWSQSRFIPAWNTGSAGLLEWNNAINPLASAIKNAWAVTTVSWSYLDELRSAANGLEALFEYEKGKCYGILNGIDTEVWDPETDPMISENFTINSCTKGKEANKLELCARFGLDPARPLMVFIGRLVGEKAADILPQAIENILHQHHGHCNFLVLGSGDPEVEQQLRYLSGLYPGWFNCMIGYNESLSHLMYAGADFLLMPSRVEPCGLNQMYAMRYGTVPVVRSTGGLKDTVTDIGDWGGWGIRFNEATVADIVYSAGRALALYNDAVQFAWVREKMMGINHSWDNTVARYTEVYQR